VRLRSGERIRLRGAAGAAVGEAWSRMQASASPPAG
jgi:hypothetical protein